MSAAKLVLDEELARLADFRGPTSAEAYVVLELREARSNGESVFAFRDPDGRYTVGPLWPQYELYRRASSFPGAEHLGPAGRDDDFGTTPAVTATTTESSFPAGALPWMQGSGRWSAQRSALTWCERVSLLSLTTEAEPLNSK